MLQSLRTVGDLGDAASSGKERTGGGVALVGEELEAKMILCVGEWWEEGVHELEGAHEVAGAEVGGGGVE